MSDSGDPEQDEAQIHEQRDAYFDEDSERRISEGELESCCQGKNVNCGHHYGRQEPDGYEMYGPDDRLPTGDNRRD